MKIKAMQKKSLKIILLVLAIVVFLGTIFAVAFYFLHRPYMAVYLATGDIYFGRVSFFPEVKIHNPWFLQTAEGGGFTLQRFSDAAWMPSGAMRINKDKIVFMSNLSKLSPVVAAIEGRNIPGQTPAQTQQQTPFGQMPPEQSPQTVPNLENIPGAN